jgi:phage-related protein
MVILHKVWSYRDKNGKSQIEEYLADLGKRKDKDSRIKLTKIFEYMTVLEEYGLSAGQPYIKHIDGDIWELRPLRDRIFFVAWHEDSFVLLHTFMKKSQKTPQREIEQAKREYKDLKERGM